MLFPLVRPPTTRIRLAHGVPKSPCRRMSEPVLASRRPREGGCRGWPRPARSSPRAGGRRTAGAISLGHAFASATWRSKRQARGAGWGEGNFPGCKPLKTNETELESPQIPPRPRDARCDAGDRLVYPQGVATSRPSSAPFAGNRRGGGCGAGKFSNPQPTEEGP